MLFVNPLHQVSLAEGQQIARDALADWALLSVEPHANSLPSWRRQRFVQDGAKVIPDITFVRQDKYRQFQCYKNTAKWCGWLLGLAYTCDTLFQEGELAQAEAVLAQEIPLIQLYPYHRARAWHADDRLSRIGWIVERMLNHDASTAEQFIQHLFVHWLHLYTLNELPTNRPDETNINYRRGYLFYGMSLNFETVRLDTPEECEAYFGRYEGQNVTQ